MAVSPLAGYIWCFSNGVESKWDGYPTRLKLCKPSMFDRSSEPLRLAFTPIYCLYRFFSAKSLHQPHTNVDHFLFVLPWLPFFCGSTWCYFPTFFRGASSCLAGLDDVSRMSPRRSRQINPKWLNKLWIAGSEQGFPSGMNPCDPWM